MGGEGQEGERESESENDRERERAREKEKETKILMKCGGEYLCDAQEECVDKFVNFGKVKKPNEKIHISSIISPRCIADNVSEGDTSLLFLEGEK